jgi:hypothetical protein
LAAEACERGKMVTAQATPMTPQATRPTRR